MELKPGIKGKQHIMVEKDNTAAMMGSGLLPVFATPSVVALMESAAMNSIALCLNAGESTVGGYIAVRHLSPTPVGMVVRAETELTAVDGKKLTFNVRAYDECGLIAEGTHERYIVNSDVFVARANAKTPDILK